MPTPGGEVVVMPVLLAVLRTMSKAFSGRPSSSRYSRTTESMSRARSYASAADS